MLWATVIIFKKTDRAKSIFETVKYIKQHYQHFCDLYRIDFRNFRNDYAFSIAVNQVNGHIQQKFLPGKLPTLPSIAKVLEINEALEDNPDLVNSDVYGEGWIVKITCTNDYELDDLLDSEKYKEMIN